MGKLNEYLLGEEQKGKPSFIETPDGANDAHGKDDALDKQAEEYKKNLRYNG
jgi:hypothetical protein